MGAAVNEERCQVVTERRRGVVDGELGQREMPVPVVLAAVGVGAQRVADDAVGPLHLGVGVLVVGRADDQARAHALDEGAKNVARELGVVVHHEHVGDSQRSRVGTKKLPNMLTDQGPSTHQSVQPPDGPLRCLSVHLEK